MDRTSQGSAGLQATTNRDEQTDTVRIDVLGSLDHATRPSLVTMIQRLRGRGIQSHIRVDLSAAVRVESAALAGLRSDLNAMEGAPGTLGGGVSLVLTGVDAEQSEDHTVVALREISAELEAEFATAVEAATAEASGNGTSERPPVPLSLRPLEEYTDEELFLASDEVFSLLDDPEAVGGPDLLGRYNDIGQEILRRTPLSELLNPAGERQAAS
jgi:ABC-type transporter Mla MlaB component